MRIYFRLRAKIIWEMGVRNLYRKRARNWRDHVLNCSQSKIMKHLKRLQNTLFNIEKISYDLKLFAASEDFFYRIHRSALKKVQGHLTTSLANFWCCLALVLILRIALRQLIHRLACTLIHIYHQNLSSCTHVIKYEKIGCGKNFQLRVVGVEVRLDFLKRWELKNHNLIWFLRRVFFWRLSSRNEQQVNKTFFLKSTNFSKLQRENRIIMMFKKIIYVGMWNEKKREDQ